MGVRYHRIRPEWQKTNALVALCFTLKVSHTQTYGTPFCGSRRAVVIDAASLFSTRYLTTTSKLTQEEIFLLPDCNIESEPCVHKWLMVAVPDVRRRFHVEGSLGEPLSLHAESHADKTLENSAQSWW